MAYQLGQKRSQRNNDTFPMNPNTSAGFFTYSSWKSTTGFEPEAFFIERTD